MEIELDAGEMCIAQIMAALRGCINRKCGIVNRRIAPDDAIDVDGAIAEIAFAKFANCYPDFAIGPRRGGVDCRTARGATVDIKSTRHPNGQLLALPYKAQCDGAQVYVLAVVKENRVRFCGWAPASELFDEKNLTYIGSVQTYALPQDRLRPMRSESAPT